MSLRQTLALSLLLLLALAYAGLASASTLIYWRAYNAPNTVSSRAATAVLSCKKIGYTETATAAWVVMNQTLDDAGCYFNDVFASQQFVFHGLTYRYTESCPYGNTGLSCNSSCVSPNYMSNGQCVTPPTCQGDSVLNQSTNQCELNCTGGLVPNGQTWTCETPSCPTGAYFDFDTQGCAYPQDDPCSAIGATWSPEQSSCVCGGGKTPIKAGGVMTCSEIPTQDPCNKDSADFAGYQGTTPMCFGKARCPDGGQPGYVGQGDTAQFVCYPAPKDDPNCNGSVGVVNGEKVCVPPPGKDPDFPDCKGVVGTFNGTKQCIEDATNDSRCAAGETAGYTGTGSEMKFVCVPSNYKPETCPAGQYTWNTATGGFGCVTLSNQDPADAGKTSGGGSSSSTTTVKDAAGNTTGTEETESEFKIEGLFHDAPNNDFKEKLEQYGQSELSKGVKTDELLREFDGQDGAFTERNKLDDLSVFVKTHTIGNVSGCSGTLPFFGYSISCDKFQTYSRILGWFIFVLTLINIYQLVMAKSESGV